MTRPDSTKRFKISEEVGPLLMLRSNVAPLFRKIAALDQTKVILDFTAVEFMSRSFADEYLTAKAASGKTIQERAVPVEVRRMLNIVTRQLSSRGGTAQDAPQSRYHQNRAVTV